MQPSKEEAKDTESVGEPEAAPDGKRDANATQTGDELLGAEAKADKAVVLPALELVGCQDEPEAEPGKTVPADASSLILEAATDKRQRLLTLPAQSHGGTREQANKEKESAEERRFHEPEAEEAAKPRMATVAPCASALSSQVPQRILCFHGYCQDPEVFKRKTGSMRKALKRCSFVFAQAPHAVDGAFPESGRMRSTMQSRVGQRGWWDAAENMARKPGEPWVQPAMTARCSGWAEGVNAARACMLADGPFDGILAFSQGCTMAAALLREASGNAWPGHPAACVRFAVFVGGFVPCDETISRKLRGDGKPLVVETLHVVGDNDELVTRSRSEEFAALFDDSRAEWLEHSGGHAMPTGTGALRDALRGLRTRGCGW